MSLTLLAPPGMPSVSYRVTAANLAAYGAATTAAIPMLPVAFPAHAIFVACVITIITPFGDGVTGILTLAVTAEVSGFEFTPASYPVDSNNGATAGVTVLAYAVGAKGRAINGQTATLTFDANGDPMSGLAVGELVVEFVYKVTG